MARTLIGLKIRERRKVLGITQAGLAAKLGISASYLNLIEGNRRNIAGALLKRIADALGVPIDQFDGAAERRLIDDLGELAADPLVGTLQLDAASAPDLAAQHPGWARALVALHRGCIDRDQTGTSKEKSQTGKRNATSPCRLSGRWRVGHRSITCVERRYPVRRFRLRFWGRSRYGGAWPSTHLVGEKSDIRQQRVESAETPGRAGAHGIVGDANVAATHGAPSDEPDRVRSTLAISGRRCIERRQQARLVDPILTAAGSQARAFTNDEGHI